MTFEYRFSTSIPEFTSKIDSFFRENDLVGKLVCERYPYRGAGIAGTVMLPTGWANVRASIPNAEVRTRLTQFFIELERTDSLNHQI